MTWSSSEPGRALGLAAFALGLAACDPTIVETPIRFGEAMSCQATTAGVTADMNTYVVTLFVNGGEAGLGDACVDCAGQGACSIAAQQCVCSRELPATLATLEAAVRGVRFSDVDPTLKYCLRLVALELAPHEITGSCACPADWRAMLAANGRVCAMTSVGAVNEAATPIEVDRAWCNVQPPPGDAGSAPFAACALAGASAP